MKKRSHKRGVVLFHPRNLAMLPVLLLLFYLRWKHGLPLWAFLTFFVVPLALYMLVMPVLARRRLPALKRRLAMLQMRGKYKEALSAYRWSLFLRAFGPPADMKRLLGQVNASLLRWDQALRAFERALELEGDADDISVLSGYGEACFHTGRDGEAVAAFSKVLSKNVHLPQAAYCLIHLYATGGDYKKARKEMKRIRWDDDRDAPLRNLAYAQILTAERKIKPAREALQRARSDDLPQSLRPVAEILEATLLFLEGKREEACDLFDRITHLRPAGRHLIEAARFRKSLNQSLTVPKA